MNRICILICILLCAGMMLLPAQDKGPAIVFDSRDIDLGKVTEGETIKHVFKFTNRGDAVLEVLKVEPS
jgi:hypothetical protein